MNIKVNGEKIPVFNLFAIKRGKEEGHIDISDRVRDFIIKTESYGYNGILLPESNAGILNPWFFASVLLNISKTLLPFIALNPAYAHPFFTAKYIANLISFGNRPLYLNYITGTALFDSGNLGDIQNHTSKYDRLAEYIDVVNGLLNNSERFTYDGAYYKIRNLSLAQDIPTDKKTVDFIAGNSKEALKVIEKTASSRLAMAMTLEDLSILNEQRRYSLGFHFGIICRESSQEAKDILYARCEENSKGKNIQYLSAKKSDVVWKKELIDKSLLLDTNDVYNLHAFSNGCTDVPYLIGSYTEVADYISGYLQSGIELIVVEIPETGSDEFYHINKVFEHIETRQ